MKILGITLENLNSLRGIWHINLEDKAYTADGIFAVTGKTGAGKTTIFDAVCLALYAKTPRLGKIDGQKNEIMSKHTDKCFAKVRFESGGRIYICEWLQNRVKGKLQTKHTISADGIQLNENQKETLSIVEKVTGMDFDRFIQAMLLEQGAFDNFLKTDKNERGKVLELITGTSIYGTVSMNVYRRCQDEKLKLDSKLNALETEKARYGGMTEQSIEAEISSADNEIAKFQEKHSLTESLRSWLEDIKKLKRDLEKVKSDIDTQSKRAEIFEGDRKILESAERAMTLEGEYSLLQSKRESKLKADTELLSLSSKISSQESKLSQISDKLPTLSDELSRLKGEINGSAEAVLKGIEAAVDAYDKQNIAAADAAKALTDSENAMKNAQASSARAMSEGKSARLKLNEANETHRLTLDRIMGMRAKTASAVLTEERAKLIEGMPCPLCGSTSHPYAGKNESSVNDSSDELFRETERLEKEFERAETAVKAAQKNFDEAVTNWHKAAAVESAAIERFTQSGENLSLMREKLRELHTAVSESIRPLKISGVSSTREILGIARAWAERVSTLEKNINDLEAGMTEIKARLSELKANFEDRRSEFESLKTELEALESSFTDRLREMNFADEESFRSARKNPDEIESIRRRKNEIDSRAAELQGILSDTQRRLDEKQAMHLTDESYDDIYTVYREEETQLRRLLQNRGVLSQKLANLRENAAEVERLQAEYDAQEKIADDWKTLNTLIGSASGDKFRVFAQQVTLELVVDNANEYLRKMNGRYTLMLTPDSTTLELSVRDSEQAGEIRPTTNLSGGERFIISLALALGLSQISGSKAQVDSLFIDEGFGSLDDEALNAALDALGEIRREGRMIGIISHVAGISERIPAQIHVIRKSEGTSIIEGPGVERRS